MNKMLILIGATVGALATAAYAKPSAKPVPVAAGYPDWRGVEEKNYVRGRHICAADLRQKVAVVVVIDAAKAADHLKQTMGAGRAFSPCTTDTQWETENIRRDFIALYTFAGASGMKGVQAAFAAKDETLKEFSGSASVYADVTCAGIPEPTELPFIYVFGPDGKEPLLAKRADTASLQEFSRILRPNMSKLPKWERFYGSVGEENSFPQLKKAVEAGKPLAPVLAALQKACSLPDAERAKEAQILADAVEQTRSDLIYQIVFESGTKPYCAQRDLNLLLRHWPGEKSNPVLAKAQKVLAGKDVSALSAIYLKTSVWSDENYRCKNAGEAKKIVQELKKMRKNLTKPKESQNIVVQNNALLLDMKIEELIPMIESAAQSK